jgi:glutathione S-transferase
VPFLEDPNSGVCLFESSAIIEYLENTYAAKQ